MSKHIYWLRENRLRSLLMCGLWQFLWCVRYPKVLHSHVACTITNIIAINVRFQPTGFAIKNLQKQNRCFGHYLVLEQFGYLLNFYFASYGKLSDK